MKNIVLSSFCYITLNSYIHFVKTLLINKNIKFSVTLLPKQEKKITLLRSPHVFKKSKEQFKISTFKVLIVLKENISSDLSKDLNYILINKPKSISLKVIA